MTVSQQVKAGLGRHIASLNYRDVERYAKASMGLEGLLENLLTFDEIEYASHFLYSATIALANATGVVFGFMLEPDSALLRMLRGLMGWNILWFL